ncbi:hypothetical protein Tco_1317120 [Tanacetum coccineum]
MSIQNMEDLKQQYLDEMKSMINQIQIKDYRNERIDIRYKRECEIKIDELKGKFNGMSIKINKKKELRQLEQAANVSTHTPERSRHFNSIYYDDDDDKESTIPLRDIIFELPLSVSSVKDLVPILSESEDTSENDSDRDLPSYPLGDVTNLDCDVTFSNPLFDFNDDYTLCYDNPLFDEEFEDISSLDPPELTLVIDEPTLRCTPTLYPVRLFWRCYCNSDSMSRSSETSYLFEELIVEFGLDDSILLKLNDRVSRFFKRVPPSLFHHFTILSRFVKDVKDLSITSPDTVNGLKTKQKQYVTPSLSDEDDEYLQLFEEETEERLKHRDQMRRWEMYMNERPLGSRRERPE